MRHCYGNGMVVLFRRLRRRKEDREEAVVRDCVYLFGAVEHRGLSLNLQGPWYIKFVILFSFSNKLNLINLIFWWYSSSHCLFRQGLLGGGSGNLRREGRGDSCFKSRKVRNRSQPALILLQLGSGEVQVWRRHTCGVGRFMSLRLSYQLIIPSSSSCSYCLFYFDHFAMMLFLCALAKGFTTANPRN